jgi:hypothetical protein
MSLGQYLRDIADGYLRSSIHSVGHGLLAQAGDRLIPLLPAGLKVEGSGGKGVATFTPWIRIFDRDETDNPQEGIDVVYIYAPSLDRVVLTLNQGVTRLRQKFGDAEARRRLSADAEAVRDGLGHALAGTLPAVNFGTAGGLHRPTRLATSARSSTAWTGWRTRRGSWPT